MATKRQLDAIETYAALMEEVKARLLLVEDLAAGRLHIAPALATEVCYLQLRMMCETISLGCLVAHGDITEPRRRLQKEWAADRIISQLSTLHADFFPQPFVMTLHGDASRTLQPKPPGFMTRIELVQLYHRCGELLHRGNVRSLSLDPQRVEHKMADIKAWAQKIKALLATHLLALVDPNVRFICILWNSSDHNRVQVAIAEAKFGTPSE